MQAEILQVASQLFKDKLDQDGDGLDLDDIKSAFNQLLADENGDVNMASLVSNLNMGSLSSMVTSWLGDGENESISVSQIKDIFSADKISGFSSQLGLSEENALNGLTSAIPAIIDKSSQAGSMLDSVGGLEGVMSMAGKFFGR